MKIRRYVTFFILMIANAVSLQNVNATGIRSAHKKTDTGFYFWQNEKRYIDTIFSRVDIKKDIEFGESVNYEGKPENLLLDIYSPAGDTEKNRPVIIWIHGGGFRYGNDKTQSYIVRMATEFAKRGYVCLSINYRVRKDPKADPKGTMNDALEDATKALDWLKANAKQLDVDVSKIIIGGGSAGGKLASNFCYKDSTLAEKWDKTGIIGLVDLWGSTEEQWTYFEIDKNDPPTIIVHGTKDELVPYELSVQLVEKLQKNNVPVELITIEDAGHTPAKAMDDFIPKIAGFLYKLIL